MTELWLPVVGFEGLYEVSDKGRVKSLARSLMRASGRVQPVKERILKGKIGASGYWGFALSKGKRQHHVTAHRLVAEAFVGLAPGKTGLRHGEWSIDHVNQNKLDNRPVNLRWMLSTENRSRANRFSADQIREIRRDSRSLKEIGSAYGCTFGMVSNIKLGKCYGSVGN